MKTKYEDNYHLNCRKNSKKFYEEKGRWVKKIRYLEKRLSVEHMSITGLSCDQLRETWTELKMRDVKQKMNPTTQTPPPTPTPEPEPETNEVVVEQSPEPEPPIVEVVENTQESTPETL